MAEKLMSQYDSVVSTNNQVDLLELVTDELLLYAPEFHLDPEECDKSIQKWIKHLD
jgi:uncharacterized protein